MSYYERLKDFFRRREAEESELRSEEARLEDEMRLLGNEARWQSEESYAADLLRKRNELERATRALFYESKEPERSMLQGRCQKLLEDIERPEAVQARLREIKERLGSLRGGSAQPDDGASVDRVAT